MKVLAIIVASGVLAGCVASKPLVQIQAPIDTKALARVHQKGTAKIEGQAFMRQAGGGVVTAAGEKVRLLAATPLTDEIAAVAKSGNRVARSEVSLNIDDHTRTTTADATGNFVFDNVAPGDYYVATQVIWSVATGRYGSSQEGGAIDERVTAIAGQTTKVIMSR